jgi:hypothetical protein
MYYLKLPHMDSPVSIFAICQAHQQLEADYNVGGILRERPSNQRRNASTGVQLHRMRYSSGMSWVDICNPDELDDPDDEDVRDIYLINVLKWGLPMDDEMFAFIKNRYTPEFLAEFGVFNNREAACEYAIKMMRLTGVFYRVERL